MTTEEYLELKYKLHDKFLRKWAGMFGITCLLWDMDICLRSGFGYLAEKRIDLDFVSALDKNDKSILSKGYAFLYRKR